MSTHVNVMAIEVERRNRYEQADRDRLINEAKSAHAGTESRLVAGLLHRSGGALIRIGSHLPGTPRVEPGGGTRPALT